MVSLLRSTAFALLLPLGLLAQPTAQGPLTEVVRLTADDPIMARLDDLAMVGWIKNSPFSTDTAAHNINGFSADHIPAWTENTYRQRLAILDARTPFDLTYNKVVQAYIDLYAVRKREMTSRMLGLAELYFPVFEEYLDKNKMPLELKYLAVVESALNPAARSRAGAVGLWQFMLPTGKMFGLNADSYIDERHDVYKSTEAACRYLKYLHSIYDDWELALAAYNCGPGNVNKAIRRSGGEKNYWKIYDHLPRETRGYVPAFIAVNYVFAHHADHNLYPIAPTYCAYEVDTVQVCYPLDLAAVAVLTGGSAKELRELNPMFKTGVVPDLDQPVNIYLPRDAAGIFVSNEELMRYSFQSAQPATPSRPQAAAVASPDEPKREVTEKKHTVRRGESLGTIANKYGTTVGEIKRLNGMRSDMIRAGQTLVVRKSVHVVEAKPAPARNGSDTTTIYHVVQPGDTLWGIAQRYPGVSVDDLKRLNTNLSEDLKPGSRIKVRAPNG